MYRFLRTPRWAAATTVVILIAFLFINLGLWQLRRNAERKLDNQIHAARQAEPAQDVGELVVAAGADIASLEYRRVAAEGAFRPDLEILVRNMTNDGVAGFHVLDPLELADGRFVIVNRGWVPLDMDRPPVPATPSRGSVTVEGLVRLSQQRPRFGPVDPSGTLAVMSRVDLGRIGDQIPGEVLPVWIQAEGPDDQLPIPVPVPSFDDPGPHMSYAIQWFSFTLIGVVGYIGLVRQHARGGKRKKYLPPLDVV